MENLSKIRRDKMIQFLETLKEQHSDDESLIAINQIEKELVSKRYGLVWEEHEENVDVMMRDNIPVFTEVPEREITEAPGERYNFLLEGDNLHSLHLLEKTHKGKIDVIYIDPPYNTGSAFEQYDDAVEHSLWLSIMKKRLIQLSELLCEEGTIWVSLDDNEVHYFKVMADEIFGRKNFIADVAWEKSDSPRMDAKLFSSRYDHTLVYAKNIRFLYKGIIINHNKNRASLH